MIDFKEVPDGETWELFARDFLQELGLVVEVPPGRGADQGKDMIAIENLSGSLGNHAFRWLVSCKHRAVSGKAVGESQETNILERMKKFRADGFMGFYSTVATSSFINTLVKLRKEREIGDFRIADHMFIEDRLLKLGMSQLLLRYFPSSHKSVKPLHRVVARYLPLGCEHCGEDLLMSDRYAANVALAHRYEGEGENVKEFIDDIYWAHKGDCDRRVEEKYTRLGLTTVWEDIGDIFMPVHYLRWVLATMNGLRAGRQVYSDKAYEKGKYLIMALAQKVLREMTASERARAEDMMRLHESGF